VEDQRRPCRWLGCGGTGLGRECLRRSSLDLLHECISAVLELCVQQVGAKAMPVGPHKCCTIELPSARMQSLAASVLWTPEVIEAVELKQPQVAIMYGNAITKVQLYGVLYHYWVALGPIFFKMVRVLGDQARVAMMLN